MTKTQELLAKIAAGTHRIDQHGFLNRWVPSRGEWMTCHAYRSDVVKRAQVALYRQSLRERICTPMTVGQAATVAATVR